MTRGGHEGMRARGTKARVLDMLSILLLGK